VREDVTIQNIPKPVSYAAHERTRGTSVACREERRRTRLRRATRYATQGRTLLRVSRGALMGQNTQFGKKRGSLGQDPTQLGLKHQGSSFCSSKLADHFLSLEFLSKIKLLSRLHGFWLGACTIKRYRSDQQVKGFVSIPLH
jgi:hypothetical protein